MGEARPGVEPGNNGFADRRRPGRNGPHRAPEVSLEPLWEERRCAFPVLTGNGSVYCGAGYGRFGMGTPNDKFYAFSLE